MSDSPRSITATSNSMGGDGWVTFGSLVSLDNVWAATDDDDEDSAFEEIDTKGDELSFEQLNDGITIISNTKEKEECCNNCEQLVTNMAVTFETKLENRVKQVKKLWKIERKIRKSQNDKLIKENKKLKQKLSKMEQNYFNNHRNSVTTTTTKTNINDSKENTINTINTNGTSNIVGVEKSAGESSHPPQTSNQTLNTTEGKDISSLEMNGKNQNAINIGAIGKIDGNIGGGIEQVGQSGGVVTKLLSVFKTQKGKRKNVESKTGNNDFNLSRELVRMDDTINEVMKECKKTNNSLNGTQLLECQSSMDKVETLLNVLTAQVVVIRSNLVKIDHKNGSKINKIYNKSNDKTLFINSEINTNPTSVKSHDGI